MKHLLITGATRGLGRALATGFARRRWAVSACGTDPAALASLAGILGGGHLVSRCDVTSQSDVASFATAALARSGPPDLLLNNAALVNRNAPLWQVPADEFSRVVDVNLKGIHLILRAFLPAMIARGSGVIVNFSSGWGRSTSPEVAPYCATKWAVEGLTQALSQELPPGLAAIPLNPGIINTGMLRSCLGAGAGDFPDPGTWAASAIPFLENLGPADNGRPLTVPF